MIRTYSGGEAVDSIGDTADRIFEARKAKPIVSYTENVGASAAYWLAASTGTVITSPYASLGSIGVFSVVDDVSAAFVWQGIKTHLIRSSRLKGIGTAGVPIGEDELAELQHRVDQFHRLFVESIACGRGMSARAVEKPATGGVWVGQQALMVGLADRLGTFEQTVADLNGQVQPKANEQQLRLQRIEGDRKLAESVLAETAARKKEEIDAEHREARESLLQRKRHIRMGTGCC